MAHGENGGDLEAGVDPIPKAAGPVRLVDQQRFARGRGRVRVSAVRAVENRRHGVGEEQDVGAAQASAGVESLVDHGRGAGHVALFEQRPSEAGVQGADEAPHADVLREVKALIAKLTKE